MSDIDDLLPGAPPLPRADRFNGGASPNAIANGHSENFFEFRGVNKGFDDRLVLHDVSFVVKRGQTCVIMGRSGVGKSVTLKLLMGFLKPDSGRIFIDGEDVTNFTEAQFEKIRLKVTMVFQSGALFDSLTVRENTSRFRWSSNPGLGVRGHRCVRGKIRAQPGSRSCAR